MSSSSSDSEDENIALLKQAVDTNFMSDALFTTGATKNPSNEEIINDNEDDASRKNKEGQKPLTNTLKSQRYIDHDEIEADLNVPKSMQDFVYKKMSKKIEDSIEFVDVNKKKKKKNNLHSQNETSCVRLLKDTEPITKIDLISEDDMKSVNNKKIELKRRVVEPDNYNDEEKIKLAAVDGESILKQCEIKNWKSKKSKQNKVFHYRKNKTVLHFIEPENEFSAIRKKNNWDESKIANSPWKHYNK